MLLRFAAHNHHDWRPVEGMVSRYRCACGEGGRRDLDGKIVSDWSAANVDPDDLITARPAQEEVIDCTGRRRRLNPDGWRDDADQDWRIWGSLL